MFKSIANLFLYFSGKNLSVKKSPVKIEEQQSLVIQQPETEIVSLPIQQEEWTSQNWLECCKQFDKFRIDISAKISALLTGIVTAGNMLNLSAMSMDAIIYKLKLSNVNIPSDINNFTPSSLHFFVTLYEESMLNQSWMVSIYALLCILTFLGMVPFNAFGNYGDVKKTLQSISQRISACHQKQAKNMKSTHAAVKLADFMDEVTKQIIAIGSGIVIGEFTSGTFNTIINLFAALFKKGSVINPPWLNGICWVIGYYIGGLPIGSAVTFLFPLQVDAGVHELSKIIGSRKKNSWYSYIKRNELPQPNTLNNKETKRILQIILLDLIQKLELLNSREIQATGVNSKLTPSTIAKMLGLNLPWWKGFLAKVVLPVIGLPIIYFGTEQFANAARWFEIGLFEEASSPWSNTLFAFCGQATMFLLWETLINLVYPKIMKLFASNPASYTKPKFNKQERIKKACEFGSLLSGGGVSVTNLALTDYTMSLSNLTINISSFIVLNSIFSYFGSVENLKKYGVLDMDIVDTLLWDLHKTLAEVRINSNEKNQQLYTEIYNELNHQNERGKYGDKVLSLFFECNVENLNQLDKKLQNVGTTIPERKFQIIPV
jgi:hypothetical protein